MVLILEKNEFKYKKLSLRIDNVSGRFKYHWFNIGNLGS